MPTYEFRCRSGHAFDKFYRSMNGVPAELDCGECGQPAARQMSGGAGLLFKGSGFYITDYGKDGKKEQNAQKEQKEQNAQKEQKAQKPAGAESGGGSAAPSGGESVSSAPAGRSDAGRSDGGRSDAGSAETAKSAKPGSKPSAGDGAAGGSSKSTAE